MEKNVTTGPKYVTEIDQLEHLSDSERVEMQKVADKYAFRSNDYYLSLIDWDDPNDPIRTIIIPHSRELDEWGELDPSDEASYTVLPGLEHKYNSTALFLVSNVCAGICRYCFRKRVFMTPDREVLRDVDAAVRYVSEHKEVSNVLLTGGDPLVLTTEKLENIIGQLSEIDHVKIIRIGTKVPVFDPYRIIEDPSLPAMLAKYRSRRRKIYVMTHFVHCRELTDVAIDGINILRDSGVEVANQTPLIRGVNDDPQVLADLLSELSFAGVTPYYIFQCRPSVGNQAYTVPIEEGYEIVEKAKARVSGLAKRARYVMSHATGKIEIVGKTNDYICLKYHRAARDEDSGRFLIFKSNPKACWLDDYDEVVRDCPIEGVCNPE